ncbi:hypothetical protein Golomagni_00260 [Golovinomyces magnicellulatus]|nr:hypothetical protein Golomagni_00260 [Golovinomyces magnicellulatus]
MKTLVPKRLSTPKRSEEKQLQKLRLKQEKEEARLLKLLEKDKRCLERDRAKVVREKERAEKAAQSAAKFADQNTKKPPKSLTTPK